MVVDVEQRIQQIEWRRIDVLGEWDNVPYPDDNAVLVMDDIPWLITQVNRLAARVAALEERARPTW